MTIEQIEQLLLAEFNHEGDKITFEDEWCWNRTQEHRHFNLVVVSDSFAWLSKVQRTQKVYKILGDGLRDGTIHALKLKTYTSDEATAIRQQ